MRRRLERLGEVEILDETNDVGRNRDAKLCRSSLSVFPFQFFAIPEDRWKVWVAFT